MKQVRKLLCLWVLALIFWGHTLKPLSIQSTIHLLSEVGAIWKEQVGAMQEVLDYMHSHANQLPQFFCGKCKYSLFFNEFIEGMLESQMGCTVGTVFWSNNIYGMELKIEDADLRKKHFAEMKQIFQTKNVDAINAYLSQILDIREIIGFWCPECYNYNWQCKTKEEIPARSTVAENTEISMTS